MSITSAIVENLRQARTNSDPLVKEARAILADKSVLTNSITVDGGRNALTVIDLWLERITAEDKPSRRAECARVLSEYHMEKEFGEIDYSKPNKLSTAIFYLRNCAQSYLDTIENADRLRALKSKIQNLEPEEIGGNVKAFAQRLWSQIEACAVSENFGAEFEHTLHDHEAHVKELLSWYQAPPTNNVALKPQSEREGEPLSTKTKFDSRRA